MKFKYSIFFYFFVLAIAGCKVGGSFKSPEAPSQTPAQYPQLSDAVDTSAVMKWWELYQDTVLQRFIKTTLDSNRNLQAAAARIESSREIAGVIKTTLYPSFGYQVLAGGGQSGEHAQKVGAGYDKGVLNMFATLNWEIDIWGKIRSQNEAAYNEYIADIDNRNALIVSLVSQVAEFYFLLRDLDNRLIIAQQTYTSRVGSTRIITDRYEKGWVAEVDKLQAQLQEYQAQAVIPQLQREIVIVQNAIRNLMGMGPGPLARGNSLYDQQLQTTIPTGLPSQLLQRRPDIHEAEKRLEAQFNRIGVAKANMYPSISLTGILGFASPQLSNLISEGGFVANGFAGLVGPLFNFNRNRRFVKVQEYNTVILAKQYEQTVLNAFSEVDNALGRYRNLVQEHGIRVNQVAVAQKALELVRAKYDYGFTSYYEVLIQENYLFDAQLLESYTYQLQLNALVSLYKALGGGWNQ